MDRARELESERASKQSDDNKSGKYKYAIFINECALQCQCTHNVCVVYYFKLWLFAEKNFCHLCTQGTNTSKSRESERESDGENEQKKMAFGFP